MRYRILAAIDQSREGARALRLGVARVWKYAQLQKCTALHRRAKQQMAKASLYPHADLVTAIK